MGFQIQKKVNLLVIGLIMFSCELQREELQRQTFKMRVQIALKAAAEFSHRLQPKTLLTRRPDSRK